MALGIEKRGSGPSGRLTGSYPVSTAGLVLTSRLVRSDLPAWHRFWTDDGQTFHNRHKVRVADNPGTTPLMDTSAFLGTNLARAFQGKYNGTFQEQSCASRSHIRSIELRRSRFRDKRQSVSFPTKVDHGLSHIGNVRSAISTVRCNLLRLAPPAAWTAIP
jgi:hypothetical protein